MATEPGKTDAGRGNGTLPSDAEVRAALARVIESEAFRASARLQHFLSYVVEAKLAGKEKGIKGKSIAAEVYDRDGDSDDFETGQNLVSVEARRLRRLLAEYYAGPGSNDEWQIRIDLGGYAPRFEPSATAPVPAPVVRPAFRNRVLLGTGVAVLALVGFAIFLSQPPGPGSDSAAPESASRAALRTRSVPALQAANLAEQARSMLFPLFDLERQQLALEIFRHSISIDPELHYGYAGAAQVLATLGLLTSDGMAAQGYKDDANRMAETALQLSPESAWAHAASGWSSAVSGRLVDGMNAARLAVKLAPQDGHILDLAGITSILANVPEFAAEVSHPDRSRTGYGRFATNNVWGVSQYMLGIYAEAIEAFTLAPESGSPVSAASLMFLAVSYDHLERKNDAQQVVDELYATWGDVPIDSLIEKMFPYAPEVERDIVARLGKYTRRHE